MDRIGKATSEKTAEGFAGDAKRLSGIALRDEANAMRIH